MRVVYIEKLTFLIRQKIVTFCQECRVRHLQNLTRESSTVSLRPFIRNTKMRNVTRSSIRCQSRSSITQYWPAHRRYVVLPFESSPSIILQAIAISILAWIDLLSSRKYGHLVNYQSRRTLARRLHSTIATKIRAVFPPAILPP